MKKILIVEDEAIVSEQLSETLEHLGYSVPSPVASGRDAIASSGKENPDLVLMDIRLQGDIDGIEAAQQINERFDIPIIYLTAYKDDSAVERAKVTEPFGFVIKPFNDVELNANIKMALYKHEMNKRLKESEEKYRELVENANSIILRRDIGGNITFFNEFAEKFFGYSQDDIIGKNIVGTIVPEIDSSGLNLKAMIEDISRHPENYENNENENIKRSGERVWVSWTNKAIRDKYGDIIEILCIGNDVTKRKRYEEELEKSREEMRNLTAHMQSVREEERTIIAREIHDELGQALTALKMDVSWLSKRFPEDDRLLSEKAELMNDLIDNTIESVRRISAELRPGLLDDLGLSAAIEWQAGEIEKRAGIRCNCEFEPTSIVVDDDFSISIFRIFQEAMTNIVRHASATEITVSLVEKENNLELRVIDNGVGISEEQISDSSSFGLIGMRERAYFCGGVVNVQGSRDRGTTVTVNIPLKK